jgi:hypothetical protein
MRSKIARFLRKIQRNRAAAVAKFGEFDHPGLRAWNDTNSWEPGFSHLREGKIRQKAVSTVKTRA